MAENQPPIIVVQPAVMSKGVSQPIVPDMVEGLPPKGSLKPTPPPTKPLDGQDNPTADPTAPSVGPTRLRPNPEDPNDPAWESVGGPPKFFEHPDPAITDARLEPTFLESVLPENFYGDWYQNAGIIIFNSLSSWIIGVFGGGLSWLMIVLTFTVSAYRTSIRHVRSRYRDDVRREMALRRLETDVESLEWLNYFVGMFWPIYIPQLCDELKNVVNQVLSSNRPPMMEDLKLKVFTLGSKPPRMEHVKTYPSARGDLVIMDWKFSFTPNDTSDLTAAQAKQKEMPKVVLEARLGKSLLSKGFDVVVQNMGIVGLIRLKIKLQLAFPHIDRVEMCFLDPPKLSYECVPFDLGFGDIAKVNVMLIPGLETFIGDMINSILGPMMYAPKVFTIEVAKLLAGNAANQAIGVLSVTIRSADGIKSSNKCYAGIAINQRQVQERTTDQESNGNHSFQWNQTMSILVTSLTDSLTFYMYEPRGGLLKHKRLGVGNLALDTYETETECENVSIGLMNEREEAGAIKADIRYFPVLTERVLEDGMVEPPPESNAGILRFTVERASDLSVSVMQGLPNPYAVLRLNGNILHESTKLRRTNSPIFSGATAEAIITDRNAAKLSVVIRDDRIGADEDIGRYDIKVNDLLKRVATGEDWFNLAGKTSGKVKMTAQWRPVMLKGPAATAGVYVKPIGVVRIRIKEGKNLPNTEMLGQSDPYVSMILSRAQKARTVTFKNSLNPKWQEVFYIPIHSANELLTLRVMDEENLTQDRQMMQTEVPLSMYAKMDEHGKYIQSPPVQVTFVENGRKDRSSRDKASRGTLEYSVAFYPTIPVVDPEEEKEEEPSTTPAPSDGSSGSRTGGSDYVHVSDGSPGGTETSKSTVDPAGPTVTPEPETAVPEPVKPLELTTENITQYGSGLLVFRLISGVFAETDCMLQILNDDSLYPAYASNKIRNREHIFNETGDVMIRELEFSKLTFRLVESYDRKGEHKEKNVLAKAEGSTFKSLVRDFCKPTTIKMKHDNGDVSTLEVLFKYIPVDIDLPARDSINNQGELRVHLKGASGLLSADRNGFSDPFCRFFLNPGADSPLLYESKVLKKTLTPVWNESFEVKIPSRVDANFVVEVYDWDLAGRRDFLGKVRVPLEDLKPFTVTDLTLPLLDKNSATGKFGQVDIGLVFRPAFITRTRLGSRTFQGKTFATAPVTAVTSVASGVKGVGVKLGSGFADFVRSGTNKKVPLMPVSDQTGMVLTEEPLMQGNYGSGEIENAHRRNPSASASLVSRAPDGETGTFDVQVLSATGLPSNSDIRIQFGPALKKVPAATIQTSTKDEKAASGSQLTKTGDKWTVSFTESMPHQFPRLSAKTEMWVSVSRPRRFAVGHRTASQTFLPQNVNGEPQTIKLEDKSDTFAVVIRVVFIPDPADQPGSVTTSPNRSSLLHG